MSSRTSGGMLSAPTSRVGNCALHQNVSYRVALGETDRTDAPMSTIEIQQALWAGPGRREGGDEIDDLAGGFARFSRGAGELGDLRDIQPGRHSFRY